MPSVHAFHFQTLEKRYVLSISVDFPKNEVGKLVRPFPFRENAVSRYKQQFSIPFIAKLFDLLQGHLVNWLVFPQLYHLVILQDRIPELNYGLYFLFQGK